MNSDIISCRKELNQIKMKNKSDELLDQIVGNATAIQKAKDQCAFLERALRDATDRLDVTQDTQARLLKEYKLVLLEGESASEELDRVGKEWQAGRVVKQIKKKTVKRQAPSANSNPSTGGGGFDREGRSGEFSREEYSYRF